ncbi:hypothetical protein Taro_055478 [Colocasia esculenta]|uniref:Transmembrane protein n=1 Tax=Colocasia esculenta TaxID=4460 RepID=A0A843XUD5_COLES|nr:hypothetical protein [Colocasia esculenta]
MMELLVEVFLVRRIVADRSGEVLLVVVGCVFGCMCSVVAERVCLWCGFHRCRFVVCGFSGRCPYFSYLCLLLALLCFGCLGMLPHLLGELWLVVSSGEVFPELFLVCSGGGFSQNFFVLVSVLLPSGLRCVVGWPCVLVRSPRTGCCCLGEGFPQDCSVLVSSCCRVASRLSVLLVGWCVLVGSPRTVSWSFWWRFSQNCLVLFMLAVVLSLKICVDRLFGLFVLVELCLDDSLLFLVEVLSRTA